MSNRLAARAAATSSSSEVAVAPGSSDSLPGTPNGFSVEDTSWLLDEDDVQGHHEGEGNATQQGRRAPPQPVAGIGVDLALLLAREAPDQAAQLLLRLGLGHQRDHYQHHGADDEGPDRLP